MIRHLTNSEIDRIQWNKLAATSGQPYTLAWWLDIVSPGWEALVEDDYKAIMPLTVKRRYGLKYVVQPRWTQQLGLMGEGSVEHFLRSIPYLSYDFNLNYLNRYNGRALERVNYIISDDRGYDKNTRRNIRRASRLRYEPVSADEFMKLWLSKNAGLGPDYASELTKIIAEAGRQDMAYLMGTYDEQGLTAALFAVLTGQRIVTLAPVSSDKGREQRAMFGLMAQAIEQRQTRIIDCEGSMLTGVARFYRGFGGREQNYHRVRRLSPRR